MSVLSSILLYFSSTVHNQVIDKQSPVSNKQIHLLSRLNKFLGLLTQSLLLFNYVTVTLLLLLLSLFLLSIISYLL